MSIQHRWNFSRIGGFDQALITSKDDLIHLASLDQKLWAALSCPVKGLQLDEATLTAIDVDGDGRVRVPEVVAAVTWACSVLKDPGLLLNSADSLSLSDFSEQEAGQKLLASSQTILNALGKSEQTQISLADAQCQEAIIANTRFNGDGVVPLAATEDKQLHTLLNLIMATQGETADLSGQPGVSQTALTAFFTELSERLTWLDSSDANIKPLAEHCDAAFKALAAVQAKIDDFFSRVRLVAFDGRTQEQLNKPVSSLETLGTTDLSFACDEVKNFPLALVAADAQLPLNEGINPAWQTAMATFVEQVVNPLIGSGKSHLNFAEWQSLKTRFSAYETWLGTEKGASLAAVCPNELRTWAAPQWRAAVEDLMQQDLAMAPAVAAFGEVKKILLLRQNVKKLLNNFVNFTEFYGSVGQAVFQAGTLYLDGRACELCIQVDDAAKHATLAGLSKCFLAYCECTRSDGAKMTIAAAFTAGDADYLLVGRNGVFYDRQGRDWDATITKLIENPISISQAFFAPYKRLIRFVEEQAAKTATAADPSGAALLDKAALVAAPKAPATPAAPEKPKFDLGMIAALGVAVGGISTALGLLMQAFFGLGWLMPLGLVGLLLAISGPSIFIAWLKLRQRNLGPVLDATGWAINGHIKINIPFGSKLTQQAKLPTGASRSLIDPYQEKATPWGQISFITVVVLVIVLVGLFHHHQKHWPWEKLTPAMQEAVMPVDAAPAAKK
ncbi:MAG: hypothetical protein RL497_967 [Pseudomonadota bacterium]|jgi:hypothetical protein